ncbi:hypothetical protein HU200_061201 [Digitaria exilis]|uniref:Uncharacterized protein n=1 Tax=Digitaria exilis TaxID=1010633 RepID=A0A835E0Z4_9POAL|nr:hypothetical protein HU200_061201 [Digitaria exilis]
MNVALVDWFDELAGSATNTAAKGTRSLAILVVWTVWCERNAKIFNELEKPIAKIIDDIKDTARLWGAVVAKHLAALVDRRISE